MSDPWKDVRERVSPSGKYLGIHPDDCEIDLQTMLADADELWAALTRMSLGVYRDDILAALPQHLRRAVNQPKAGEERSKVPLARDLLPERVVGLSGVYLKPIGTHADDPFKESGEKQS